MLKHQNATRGDTAGAPLAVADVARLVEVYADDLADLAALSGLDIGHWPTCRVLSGDLAVGDFAARVAAKAGLPLAR